jgi:hypothetical protein
LKPRGDVFTPDKSALSKRPPLPRLHRPAKHIKRQLVRSIAKFTLQLRLFGVAFVLLGLVIAWLVG